MNRSLEFRSILGFSNGSIFFSCLHQVSRSSLGVSPLAVRPTTGLRCATVARFVWTLSTGHNSKFIVFASCHGCGSERPGFGLLPQLLALGVTCTPHSIQSIPILLYSIWPNWSIDSLSCFCWSAGVSTIVNSWIELDKNI